MVGIPPPPAQITTQPGSSSHLMGRRSKIRRGTGEGTTLRMLSSSGLNAKPRSAASLPASGLSYSGPIGLLGSAKAGSSGSTSTIVSSEASGLSNGSRFPSSCSMR